MMLAKEMDLRKAIALSQADRIVMVMIAACCMPLVLHAIPWLAGSGPGMRWLPMFYAPLIASVCFRPHVSLIAGACAPVINHALFGMPNDRILPGMIFELVILSAALAMISARRQVRGWHAVSVFILVRALSLWIFSTDGETFVFQLQHSLLTAWPGIVVLGVLADIAGRIVQRKGR